MDLDALLARSLQAEEAQQQQPSDRQQQVLGILRENEAKALSVEDEQLFARARSLMPLEVWRQSARQHVELNRLLEPGSNTASVNDLVVKSMLQWFKQEFFVWMNAPPCSTCGHANTQHTGMGAPGPAEAGHATRVELYNCSVCGQTTRFPRYTSPGKLLDSRKGRCGEWAHCFLLMLRAAGYDARHVCDNADHVWNEYWSEGLGRWVHVDSCEAAWDTPLLYEGGWGKALAFVMAASRHGHTDVTRRYVLPTALPQLSTRRAGVPEPWLIRLLQQLNTRMRGHLGQPQRRALAAREAIEALQLMSLQDGPAAAAAVAAAGDLPGRQSGAEAWRVARGETGSSNSSRQTAPPATTYVYAADTSLPPLFNTVGRLSGGVCRASGENTGIQPTQIPGRLFDGCLSTKWLDFTGRGPSGSAWVEYRLLPSQDPVIITHYDVISAEDCPERDPCDWVLEAASTTTSGGNGCRSSSSSGTVSDSDGWVVLHARKGHRFTRRHQLCSFTVSQEGRVASRRWRLRITRTAEPSAANSLQLSCWNLYSTQQESQEQGLLYLDDSSCQQLQAAAAAGAAGDDARAASSNGSVAGVDAAAGSRVQCEALITLNRVLTNVQQQSDSKFFKLSVKASKLQQLLSDPLLQAAVFAAGFRPVLQEAPAGQQHGELALVADDSTSSTVRAAASRLLQLTCAKSDSADTAM